MEPEILDRFLRYVKIHTTSQENMKQTPSTARQFDLANLLAEELKSMGIQDVSVDEHCILYCTVPSNLSDDETLKVPVICFIAHIDTSPAEPGENIKPQIVNWDGGDIRFPNNPELVISSDEILPGLEVLKENNRIVITDGTTLLGADDKAGVAEIMTAISTITKDSSIRHGTIKVLFTPDEEVGHGVGAVDLEKLGADFAYTLDGGALGEFETENFNACNAHIVINGYNVHPGAAYGKLINAMRALPEILKLFPDNEAPETTKDREGYYHPLKITGDVNSVRIDFLLRDFDAEELENKIRNIEKGIDQIRTIYPKIGFSLGIKKPYRNMVEELKKHPKVISIAEEAINRIGVKIIDKPIRGGTDGAQLSFRGLPTPNIFNGGINFHSKKEFIPVYSMEKAVEVILNIIDISVQRYLN